MFVLVMDIVMYLPDAPSTKGLLSQLLGALGRQLSVLP